MAICSFSVTLPPQSQAEETQPAPSQPFKVDLYPQQPCVLGAALPPLGSYHSLHSTLRTTEPHAGSCTSAIPCSSQLNGSPFQTRAILSLLVLFCHKEHLLLEPSSHQRKCERAQAAAQSIHVTRAPRRGWHVSAFLWSPPHRTSPNPPPVFEPSYVVHFSLHPGEPSARHRPTARHRGGAPAVC